MDRVSGCAGGRNEEELPMNFKKFPQPFSFTTGHGGDHISASVELFIQAVYNPYWTKLYALGKKNR